MDQYGFAKPRTLTASSPEYYPQGAHRLNGPAYGRSNGGMYQTNMQSQNYSVAQANPSLHYENYNYNTSNQSASSSPNSSPPHSPNSGRYVQSPVYNSTETGYSALAPNGYKIPQQINGAVEPESSIPQAFETNLNTSPTPRRNIPTSRSVPPSSLFHYGNIFLDWKL